MTKLRDLGNCPKVRGKGFSKSPRMKLKTEVSSLETAKEVRVF